MFTTIKQRLVSDSKDEIERRFQRKINVRHLIISLLIAIFSTLIFMTEDYIFTKNLDEHTFLFLIGISGVLFLYYFIVSDYEYNLHYKDLRDFRVVTGTIPVEEQIKKAFKEIEQEISDKVEEKTMETLSQFIIKQKDDIEQANT